MGKRTVDWSSVQKFYDHGNSWRDTQKQFDLSIAALANASKRGDFVSRGRSAAGVIKHKRFPQLHSAATKAKISKGRTAYLKAHPDQVPYLLNHCSKGDSYPEKYFEAAFRNEGIVLTKKFQISLYQLDFCDPIKKIDIEIDGDQHYLDPRIAASDVRRTLWLEERGWKVFRIRWSDFKKMSMDARRAVVDQVKKSFN